MGELLDVPHEGAKRRSRERASNQNERLPSLLAAFKKLAEPRLRAVERNDRAGRGRPRTDAQQARFASIVLDPVGNLRHLGLLRVQRLRVAQEFDGLVRQAGLPHHAELELVGQLGRQLAWQRVLCIKQVALFWSAALRLS